MFGIKHKNRRKVGIGGFHADYLDNKTARRQAKQMGYIRSIFSAISLLFGALMIYVTLHYLPAFLQPQKILGMTDTQLTSARLKDEGPIRKLMGPYADLFTMKRTYLRSGQTIQAQYAMPPGAVMTLKIKQCRSLWIVEVFECQVVSKQSIRITNPTGSKSFQFPETGFYHFDESVKLPKGKGDYRVVWVRK